MPGISWLVGTAAAPLVESNRMINRLFYFRRHERGLRNAVGRHLALVRDLTVQDFDCVVDLQGLLRSAVFAYATGARVRVGLSDAREGARLFYTDRVEVDRRMHAVDRYLKVGEVLGFDAREPEFSLEAPESAHRSVCRLLAGASGPPPRPWILLSPGARWASKCWPAGHFADAGAILKGRFGGTYFIVGSQSAAGDGVEIAERLGDSAVNLIGRTSLEELVALLSKSDLLITADTGIVHMADAIGTPLVAVYGPTDPVRTGPYCQRERVVVAHESCEKMPCLKRECDDAKCMKGVSGADVASKAADVLEGRV